MDSTTNKKAIPHKFNKKLVIGGAVILVIALVTFFISQSSAPRRSIASYCKVYSDEKVRLAKLPGSSWPSGVFNEEVGDAGEFATSFSKLEAVAPDEVRGDVTTLKSVYEKIQSDPSQAISASLSGTSADSDLKAWTKQNCNS